MSLPNSNAIVNSTEAASPQVDSNNPGDNSLPPGPSNGDATAASVSKISQMETTAPATTMTTGTTVLSASPAVDLGQKSVSDDTKQAATVESLVTQVKQSSAPTTTLKASIEAAKRRVAKLEAKGANPTSAPLPIVADAPIPVGAAISSISSENTTQTTLQSNHLSSPRVAELKAKKQKAAGSSIWSTLFSCCCHQLEGDTVSVAMAPVSKPAPAIQKPPAVMGAPTTTKLKQQDTKKYLLKPLLPIDVGRKCLVLDLDETLVHSSFKPVPDADFIIPVEIDKTVHNVYVLKRPGVDTFLQRLGTQFEIVVFTASLAKYADPVLDMLDKHSVVKHRLFREACIHHKGNYVKDLSLLGRDLKDVIIIDNSPSCYLFHPANAMPITSWFDDPNDTELLDLIPFLEDLKLVDNVTVVLDNSMDD
ncbi:hypothetical protein BASA84_001639 [Batrachochytrium salamandrivorans]|nr:hypothetical protein BASA84_001639 [Batrachochytrium salamandrivorans]